MDHPPLKVDNTRWEQAQAWELKTWLAQNIQTSSAWSVRSKGLGKRLLNRGDTDLGDDWNFWWAEKFEGYRVLPAELDNVIELGCGPYTNIRLICQSRRFRHIFCSDPLARHYITFSGRWLAEAWRRGHWSSYPHHHALLDQELLPAFEPSLYKILAKGGRTQPGGALWHVPVYWTETRTKL